MKVTLREARKITERISHVLNKSFDVNRVLNIYEEVDVTEWLTSAQKDVTYSVNQYGALLKARSLIRRNVQILNEEKGINEAIAIRKELKDTVTFWKVVLLGDDYGPRVEHVPVSAPTLMNKRTARQDPSVVAGLSGRGENILVCGATATLLEQAKNNIRLVTSQLDSIEDQLAVLNSTTTLELDADTVEVLTASDIL